MKSAEKQQNPHVFAAESYVSAVISGKIPASKWVKLACERHRRDIASSITKAFPHRFDADMAARACKFIERLPHTKGKWAKKDPKTGRFQTIVLEPWQCFIVASLFGWVRKDNGKRRFRKARIYVPRKNAKTTLLASVGLYMFAADNEPGAEVYCGATSEQQAKTLFEMVRQMCMKTPALVRHFGLTVNVSSVVKQDGSVFKPVIGKPGDGDSPHCAIVDEYHEHSTSDQLDTMETGMGAREQPMSIVISTAGANTAGPCRDDWKNCERILEALDGFTDDSTFAIIYGLDQGDRWDCEESLAKANPNWGVSVNRDHMLADMRDAQARASQQSKFRTKHLNEWVSVKEAFFNAAKWSQLARKITREDFKEFPCFIAADFASHLDLTAVMQVFCLPDERFAVFGKYYLPAATFDKPENQHYRNWHIAGMIEKTGEEVMDFAAVREDIIKMHTEYNVREFIIDPTRMWGEVPNIEKEGIEVVLFRQVVLNMSPPMKRLEALIESGKIIHNGDPILSWAVGNVTAQPDNKENVYPRKEVAANKIDPVIAILFALNRDSALGPEDAGAFIAAW